MRIRRSATSSLRVPLLKATRRKALDTDLATKKRWSSVGGWEASHAPIRE